MRPRFVRWLALLSAAGAMRELSAAAPAPRLAQEAPAPQAPIAAPAPTARRPSPYDHLQRGHYLAALKAAEAASAAAPRDPMAIDTLAMMRSFTGDATGALAAFEAQGSGATADARADLALLDRCEPQPALDAIVAAARDRRVVILNEGHHVAQHRAFSLELARRLRELGFSYFAAETFDATQIGALARLRHPTRRTGFYCVEPVFGDLVRQVLKLGYRPIAYEIEASATADSAAAGDPGRASDPFDRINAREIAQSQHLIERIFRRDPDAKVFVHVGYSHATENWRKLDDGRDYAWMAARLGRELGIDPLTIDQTEMRQASTIERSSPVWRRALERGWLAQPVVLQRPDGSAFVGGDGWRGGVDLQLFHPAVTLVDGRPDWLAMDGYRKPVEIPLEIEATNGRLLVLAFVAAEPDDAVPMDQVVLRPGEPAPALMLPDGDFRLVVQDEAGNELARMALER